jgi:group I intron endonuclease
MKAKLEDSKKSGIYCIKNLINNKIYVGKAKDIHKRIKAHITSLNTKSKDENRHLINAWHKYGRENFDYYILEYLYLDESLLKNRERYWQIETECLNRNIGYNLRFDSETNVIVSRETRDKMSISGNKRMAIPEQKQKATLVIRNYWKDNPDKILEMARKVSEVNSKYTIVQLDSNLNIIKEWTQPELRKSEYYLPNILQHCNGGRKGFYKNCIWRYKNKINGEIIFLEIPKVRDFRVVMLDKEKGNMIKFYESSKEANLEFNHGKGNINVMCKNKLIWKKFSYYFRYNEDVNLINNETNR